MAFEGEITAAVRNRDGSVTIRLQRLGFMDRNAQVALTVASPPPYFEMAVVGTQVTGNSQGTLFVAGVPFLVRVGYTRVRLAPRPKRKS